MDIISLLYLDCLARFFCDDAMMKCTHITHLAEITGGQICKYTSY